MLDEYDALLSFNGIFISRTANVGVIPRKMALDYGLAGLMNWLPEISGVSSGSLPKMGTMRVR